MSATNRKVLKVEIFLTYSTYAHLGIFLLWNLHVQWLISELISTEPSVSSFLSSEPPAVSFLAVSFLAVSFLKKLKKLKKLQKLKKLKYQIMFRCMCHLTIIFLSWLSYKTDITINTMVIK